MISYCSIGGLLLCLWGLEGVLLEVGSHRILADTPDSATSGLLEGHGHEGCLPETPQLCRHSDKMRHSLQEHPHTTTKVTTIGQEFFDGNRL